MSEQEREFLFEYRFDGDVYGLPVVAKDIETAERKVGAMVYAHYKGEVAAKIPLPSLDWIDRTILWIFGIKRS